MKIFDLISAFAKESNRIEGIKRTTQKHIAAHHAFIVSDGDVDAIIALVKVLQPNARFRDTHCVPGVRVGSHIAPPSRPEIRDALIAILAIECPWEQHIAYETLHPFTDGNGRSGRALWMRRHIVEHHDDWALSRGFLHSWYYHTLQNVRTSAK